MTASLPRRYLDLLKASLLNEIYLENEVRLLYIYSTLSAGKPIDGDVVRNIGERLPDLVARVRSARADGQPWWVVTLEVEGRQVRQNFRNICEFSHTMIGRKRLDNLESCLDAIVADDIAGDMIETGAWRGGASIFMRGYLAAHAIVDRTVWVADSFEGLPKPSLPEDHGFDFSAARMPILAISLSEVQENFRRYGLLDEQVRFLKGWFKDTLPGAPIERIAVARLDGDLYESTRDALDSLYERVVPGGYLIVDDYGDFEPCRRAVDEFRRRGNISSPLQTIDWTGVYWRKE
jgi:hypothetical protein